MQFTGCTSWHNFGGCVASGRCELIAKAVTQSVTAWPMSQGKLTRCTAETSVKNGIEVSENTTVVQAMDCRIQQNGEFGAAARGRAVMLMKDCASSCNKATGYFAGIEAKVTVTKGSSDGNATGAEASGGVLTSEEVLVDGVSTSNIYV